MSAPSQREQLRRFALTLPSAAEDFPWGEPVVKVRRDGEPPAWRRGLVHGNTFLWHGRPEDDDPKVSVKLTESYEQAVTVAGATPMTHSGLGQWGWLTFSLSAAPLDVVFDWVEESWRAAAPKKLLRDLASQGRLR